MIDTLERQRQITPSQAKYGSLILADGFTQTPRSLEDYLNTLDLCSTEKLLVTILNGYRWQEGDEIFPSVRTLAERCKVSMRRINQMTAHLEALSLVIKKERFAGRSQLSNYYDLEPLYQKTIAWKNAEAAAALAEQEAHADEPFEPQDVLEQAAQVISEEFGEPEPRQVRYNVTRMGRRYNRHPDLDWQSFADIIEKAVTQTEQRRDEPTRAQHTFVKLVPYFFSALDYWLDQAGHRYATQAQTPGTQTQGQEPQRTTPLAGEQPQDQNQDRQQQQRGPSHRQPKKSGLLAERAAERRAAEANGRPKVRPPQALARAVSAAALTFNDDQEKSSSQRAANLMADAQLDEEKMCELVAAARAITSKCCTITRKNKHGKINRMPYFFATLEELATKAAEERACV